MPNIAKIDGKKGISYKLTAYCGYDAKGQQIRKFKTWKPDRPMTAKQAEKEANRQAQLFEDAVNKGLAPYDGTIKFESYSDKFMETAQIAPKTRTGCEIYLKRINKAIGHIKLQNLQAHHLEAFYKNLAEDNINSRGRSAISNGLVELMEKNSFKRDRLAQMAGVAPNTMTAARQGKKISIESANKIAAALDVPTEQIFTLQKHTGGLSDKTILHHHRLISAILGKAKKERIIAHNVAAEHATAPKVKKKEAKYLDDEDAKRLVELLLGYDDIRITTSILLALCSGCRRGELLGLSWDDIDEKRSIIHVIKASQYQSGVGVVEVSTKNESSMRAVKLPPFMFEVLSQYKKWWLQQKLLNGSKWQGDENRLFIQANGKPLFPDTINYWLDKFIEKHELQHFTPHSLRHTFSTLQIMAGVNLKTVQARTGHSQLSTLTDLYAHAIKSADEMATDVLDYILSPDKDNGNVSV